MLKEVPARGPLSAFCFHRFHYPLHITQQVLKILFVLFLFGHYTFCNVAGSVIDIVAERCNLLVAHYGTALGRDILFEQVHHIGIERHGIFATRKGTPLHRVKDRCSLKLDNPVGKQPGMPELFHSVFLKLSLHIGTHSPLNDQCPYPILVERQPLLTECSVELREEFRQVNSFAQYQNTFSCHTINVLKVNNDKRTDIWFICLIYMLIILT